MAVWQAAGDGVVLAVTVKPGQRRAGVLGVVTDARGRVRLALAVTAPAREGCANEAVRALLAEMLDVPRGRVAVIAGESAREKRLHVTGDPAGLSARLAALEAEAGEIKR
jgi:uncharacterized protein (TIGR00251 family)